MMTRREFGNTIRQARVQRDLSIVEVFERSRINKDFIENIEKGILDFLPPVYVTGFVKKYAQILNLDVNLVVANFKEALLSPEPDESAPPDEPPIPEEGSTDIEPDDAPPQSAVHEPVSEIVPEVKTETEDQGEEESPEPIESPPPEDKPRIIRNKYDVLRTDYDDSEENDDQTKPSLDLFEKNQIEESDEKEKPEESESDTRVDEKNQASTKIDAVPARRGAENVTAVSGTGSPPVREPHGPENAVLAWIMNLLPNRKSRIMVLIPGALLVFVILIFAMSSSPDPADRSGVGSDVSGSENGEVREIPLDEVEKELSQKIITKPKFETLVLNLTTIDSVWFKVVIDGDSTLEYLLPPGASRQWEATKRYEMRFGNSYVKLKLNGSDLGPIAENGRSVFRLVITEDGIVENIAGK